MEGVPAESPKFWKTLFSEKALQSILFKIAAGSLISIICILILIVLVIGLGMFDAYVGFISTWATGLNLAFVCDAKEIFTGYFLSWLFCGAIGLIDSVATVFILAYLTFLVALACCLPVHFYQSYREQYIREKYLESDTSDWTV